MSTSSVSKLWDTSPGEAIRTAGYYLGRGGESGLRSFLTKSVSYYSDSYNTRQLMQMAEGYCFALSVLSTYDVIHNLNSCIEEIAKRISTPEEFAHLADICYGALRYLPYERTIKCEFERAKEKAGSNYKIQAVGTRSTGYSHRTHSPYYSTSCEDKNHEFEQCSLCNQGVCSSCYRTKIRVECSCGGKSYRGNFCSESCGGKQSICSHVSK